MLYYAEEADFCRSKVLLHYFGEKDAQPCEQCDVCRIRKSHPHADATDEQITALILETLKDGQKHNLSEMTFPGISREKTAQLLHQMIEGRNHTYSKWRIVSSSSLRISFLNIYGIYPLSHGDLYRTLCIFFHPSKNINTLSKRR